MFNKIGEAQSTKLNDIPWSVTILKVIIWKAPPLQFCQTIPYTSHGIYYHTRFDFLQQISVLISPRDSF